MRGIGVHRGDRGAHLRIGQREEPTDTASRSVCQVQAKTLHEDQVRDVLRDDERAGLIVAQLIPEPPKHPPQRRAVFFFADVHDRGQDREQHRRVRAAEREVRTDDRHLAAAVHHPNCADRLFLLVDLIVDRFQRGIGREHERPPGGQHETVAPFQEHRAELAVDREPQPPRTDRVALDADMRSEADRVWAADVDPTGDERMRLQEGEYLGKGVHRAKPPDDREDNADLSLWTVRPPGRIVVLVMRVFVTGATGFIGSAVVQELLGTGHQVLGLARSDAAAQALTAAGATPHRGDVQDLESLRSGAAQADAVIHLAFIYGFTDFAQFIARCETDRRAIEALGEVLIGSDRRLVVTSGAGIGNVPPGTPSTEDDAPVAPSVFPRAESEAATEALVARGVNTVVVRLPQVHAREAQGLITPMIAIARAQRVSAYIGDGQNRWTAAHRLDVAHLYCLALEHGVPGARYNAVAEEAIPVRDIAEVIGRRLEIPVASVTTEEALERFGWLGRVLGTDMPASSALTRERLGWNPTGIGLLEDLEHNARDLETPVGPPKAAWGESGG